MTVQILPGDCREVIKTLADDSVDSVVTDPPYSLTSIVKRFGNASASDNTKTSDRVRNRSDGHARTAAGFMGKKWDTGEVAHDPAFWAEVLRVMKPGAHLVAFGGTRTYHRMACAIEDAGFEIRDQIGWCYASGFPKSLNVSKAIDKAAGAEREVVGRQRQHDIRHHAGEWENYGEGLAASARQGDAAYADLPITVAATASAIEWEGWGTALKPAWEPIVLSRKPLSERTVAANVLRWGTGAINIDGCRVDGTPEATRFDPAHHKHDGYRMTATGGECAANASPLGRWPANIAHDGSDEVVAAFPDSGGAFAPVTGGEPAQGMGASGIYGHMARDKRDPSVPRGDEGSAARFFFTAPSLTPCALCGWPCGDDGGIIGACSSVSSAASNSPSPGTASPPGSVQNAALDCSPQDSVANSLRSSGHAINAESPSAPRHPITPNTAHPPAETWPLSRIVQNVRSAASLCASCATAIAQSLAASRLGQDPALPRLPASISATSRLILTRSLALYVADRESTDTILTTPSLSELFGSVFHAIAESTKSERSEEKANTESDQRRFHFSSKADSEDRWGSRHPTVKPVGLIRWLMRLVTPPGGTVCDPFAGSGTAGVAAIAEGFDAILVEREAEYLEDIRARIAFYEGEGRHSVAAKARRVTKPKGTTPLFDRE